MTALREFLSFRRLFFRLTHNRPHAKFPRILANISPLAGFNLTEPPLGAPWASSGSSSARCSESWGIGEDSQVVQTIEEQDEDWVL